MRWPTIALIAVWLVAALFAGVAVYLVLLGLACILAREYVWRAIFGGRWFGPSFPSQFGEEESFARRKRQIAAERRRAARQSSS